MIFVANDWRHIRPLRRRYAKFTGAEGKPQIGAREAPSQKPERQDHMTEQEMRKADVPWPKSMDELTSYIKGLVEQEHDYGTCVYAMSMSALATFYYVSHVLGVTGFQASCADMDFLRRSRRMERFQILDLGNLLFPQYRDKFKSIDEMIAENIGWLADEARKKIAETNGECHPEVLAYWQMLANLKPEDARAEQGESHP